MNLEIWLMVLSNKIYHSHLSECGIDGDKCFVKVFIGTKVTNSKFQRQKSSHAKRQKSSHANNGSGLGQFLSDFDDLNALDSLLFKQVNDAIIQNSIKKIKKITPVQIRCLCG